MTREEAIAILSEKIKPCVLGEWDEATDMAIEALQAEAEPKMTEEVREALMRLTMCAREECDMCKYKDECGFDFQYKISTDNMNTLIDALLRSKCEVDAKSAERGDADIPKNQSIMQQSRHDDGKDLISRADVLDGLKHSTAYLHDDIYTIVNRIPSAETTGALDDAIAKYVADGLMELPTDGDLIRREDAVNAICKHSCYTEYGLCPNVGFPRTACGYVEAIQLLPSADAVHKPDYSYEADMVRRLKIVMSFEAEDREDGEV